MIKQNLKKIAISVLSISICACGLLATGLNPSTSWFESGTYSNVGIDGNVHGSYFESGDGSLENPFEIAHPIQLYYLAWLQEMGYFNQYEIKENTTEVTLKQQYHFYLSSDLDMEIKDPDGNSYSPKVYYELPPIGTVNYPFVGSFDGKGYKISNLKIINDRSEYTNDPHNPTNVEANQAPAYQVLGMFGVLGTTNTETNTDYVKCSQMDTNGNLSPYTSEAKFTPAENYITNFYLENVSISASSDTDKVVLGAVAGFANAPISNVGIKGATVNIAGSQQAVTDLVGDSEVLSNYLSLGYVTNDYIRNVNIFDHKVYAPEATAKTFTANSSGGAWGGSINIDNLLKRINKSTQMTGKMTTTVLPYPKRETRIYNGDQLIQTETTYDNRPYNNLYYNNRWNTVKTCYYSSDRTASIPSDETIGSYYWIDQGSTSDTGQHKAYVGGYTNMPECTSKSVYTMRYTGAAETVYCIRSTFDNTGNNFIGINTSGQMGTNYSQANAAKWHLQNGALYTHVPVYYNTTNYNGSNPANQAHETFYYLNCTYSRYNNTATFSISNSSNTNWTLTENGLKVSGMTDGYRISSGQNYLCSNSGYNGISNTNTKSSATIWTVEDFGSSNQGKIYVKNNNNQNVYLRISNTSSTGNLQLNTTNSNNSFTRSSNTATNSYAYIFANKYYNYILYNRSWTNNRQSQVPSANLNFEYVNPVFGVTTDTEQPFTISSETIERSGLPGYIPLTTDGDNTNEGAIYTYQRSAIDIQNFYTSSLNTGYIVGGYYDRYNGNGSGDINKNNFGDVRIAQYDKSYVANSYSNDQFSQLYTINDSCYSSNEPIVFDTKGDIIGAETPTNLNFKKLANAVKNLGLTLGNSSKYVSGVHFMDSSISKDKTIIADKVKINGELKRNFEMPEDSIDFCLKDKGYINFFAGNYHEQNNSFFALHKIERQFIPQNGNTEESNPIVSIKKIKYIFKNVDDPLGDYIYLYDDEGAGYSWSDGASMSSRPVSKNNFQKNGENYSFAFDTKWIGVNETLIPHTGNKPDGENNTEKRKTITRIYYFEIPVNEGEYALGSCVGGCGGYLDYLDISAASQTIQRKEVNELFNLDKLSGTVPYGTQFVDSIRDIQDSDYTYKTDGNGQTYLDKEAIIRKEVTSIDDLNSYYGKLSTSATGTYQFDRSGNNVTGSSTTGLSNQYIGDGLTFNTNTRPGKNQQVIRRITDYDYNTVSDIYVRQITTIVIEGTGSSAHNYATTTLEYNETGFTSDYTLIARYSYDWIGDGPFFSYNYYLHVSNAGNSGIEVIFGDISQQELGFQLKVEYVADSFELTCGTNQTVVTSADIVNDQPVILDVPISAETGVIDVWYAFSTTTKIAAFHYICEADLKEGEQNRLNEVVDYDFVFSGYDALQTFTADAFPDVESSINIINGKYTYNFSLSGTKPTSTAGEENTWYYIYYSDMKSGTYVVIQSENGSEYIVYVDSSNS